MGWLLGANVFSCEFLNQFKYVLHFQLLYSHFYAIFNQLHLDIISNSSLCVMSLFAHECMTHGEIENLSLNLDTWVVVQGCLIHTLPLGRERRGGLHQLFWNIAIAKTITFIFYKICKHRNDSIYACLHSTNVIKKVQSHFNVFFSKSLIRSFNRIDCV